MSDKSKVVYKKGVVPRSDEFQSSLKTKGEVLSFIENTVESETESAFTELGYRKSDKPAGFYANDTAYGMGAATGFFNVKIGGQTQTMMEKHIVFGAKRMSVELHVFIHANTKTMDMRYKTTEASALRGYSNPEGPMMINQQLHFDLKDMEKFKNEFKKKMREFANKEAEYMTSTKLGVEDPVEKSTASMVESTSTSLNDILSSDEDSFMSKLDEMFNIPDVFSITEEKDTSDIKEKEKEEDLLLSDEEEDDKDKESIQQEITSAGSGAGSIGKISYDAPFGKVSKRRFSDTEMGKRQRLKETSGNWGPRITEGDDGFWQVVSQETLDSYKKDHIMGAPGAENVEVNSEAEEEYNSGGYNKFPQGKSFKKGDFEKHNASIKEAEEAQKKSIEDYLKIDPSVRKKWNRENVVTESERRNRWERLSTFETNETIKRAEDNSSKTELNESVVRKANEEKEVPLKRDHNIDEGDFVNGKKVIKITKSNSLYNIDYLVHESDYLNEGMAYIHDFITGNLVNNPNYKANV